MAFEPENPLEDALLRAQTEASARPEFFDRLLSEKLIVPGECGRAEAVPGDRLDVATMRVNGRVYIPVFSSITRLGAHGRTPFFYMRGRDLLMATRGSEFVLNPGAEIGKVLTTREITFLLDPSAPREAEKPPQVFWREPKVYPQKLVDSLKVLFANRADILSAALVEAAFSDRNEPPHPMIGIEVEGDWRKTFREVSEITRALLPDVIVDFIPLNRAKPMDQLAEILVNIAPFYVRANNSKPN
jgi:hypothetical protein